MQRFRAYSRKKASIPCWLMRCDHPSALCLHWQWIVFFLKCMTCKNEKAHTYAVANPLWSFVHFFWKCTGWMEVTNGMFFAMLRDCTYDVEVEDNIPDIRWLLSVIQGVQVYVWGHLLRTKGIMLAPREQQKQNIDRGQRKNARKVFLFCFFLCMSGDTKW